MIKRVELKNFTVLPDGVYEFSPNLNVFIAENGKGKSHLLKLIYCLTMFGVNPVRRTTSEHLKAELEGVLLETFRPDSLNRLIRREQGLPKLEVKCQFSDAEKNLAFSVGSKSKTQLQWGKIPSDFSGGSIFFPTREVLSFCPWFLAAYDSFHLEFERPWRDTCLLLQTPARKGKRTKAVSELLSSLGEDLQGSVVMDSNTNRFYLKSKSGQLEMPLVAEGLRKLAMLYRLLQIGIFEDKRILVWDEPEANLNPKYIRQTARYIWKLSGIGVQVFIATHSMVLLRELTMLQARGIQEDKKGKGMPVRWFSLAGPNEPLDVANELPELSQVLAMTVENEQALDFLQMDL